MATLREIRRLAFQALYQLDAHGNAAATDVQAWLATQEGVGEKDRAAALEIAKGAFAERHRADTAFRTLAPAWPAHRQPAVDRAILRLAYFEMTAGQGKASPKAVINDAVEFAKEFSTEKSPAFVNGLLDKIYKASRTPAAPAGAAPEAGVAAAGVATLAAAGTTPAPESAEPPAAEAAPRPPTGGPEGAEAAAKPPVEGAGGEGW